MSDKRDDVIFHYNKHHNWDPSTPPWAVKFKGVTYYVNHMTFDSGIGFSTKEQPGSENTKAMLRVRGKLRIIEFDDGSVEAIVEGG